MSNQEAGIRSFVLNTPTASCAVTPVLDVAITDTALLEEVRASTFIDATSGNPNA